VTHDAGPRGFKLAIARATDGTGAAKENLGPSRAGPDTGAIQNTVGYEYALSKRTALFTYASRLKNKRNGAYDFAINEVGVVPGTRLSALALGMRHSF
jgi:predicted porin